MELIELSKGDEIAIVEKGSQAEKDMRALGFSEKKVAPKKKK